MLSKYQLLLGNPLLSEEGPERVSDLPRTAEQDNGKETGLRKEDWVPNRAVRKSDPRGMHIQDTRSSIQGNLHVRSIVLLVELDIEPNPL